MARVKFTTRQEPFGATKRRGKQYAAERKLKNRIHELEEELSAMQRREAHAHASAMDAERRLGIAQPTAGQKAAIHAFGNLPAATLVELKLVDEGLELARWSNELHGKTVVQTGANIAERARRNG